MVSYDKAIYTEPKVPMQVLPCHRRIAPFFLSLSKARDKIYFSIFTTELSLRLQASPHQRLHSPPGWDRTLQ